MCAGGRLHPTCPIRHCINRIAYGSAYQSSPVPAQPSPLFPHTSADSADRTTRFFRPLSAHRYVDALAAPHRRKINPLRFVLSDINRVAAPPQFKIHDVFRQATAAGRQREGQRMELRVGGQNMSSYIEIKNVSKSFGGRAILQNVPCSQNREQLLAWLALTAAESRCCSRLYME